MSAGDLRPGINKIIYRDGQVFYLYLPRSASAGDGALRLLASIHGYSGQSASASGRARVKKAAERWAAHAETHGWIVLAPQFDEDRFAGEWQRLNLFGLRADHRLQALIRATKNLAPRLKTDRILLFGFSGGGSSSIGTQRFTRIAWSAPWPREPDGTCGPMTGFPTRWGPRREVCPGTFGRSSGLCAGETSSSWPGPKTRRKGSTGPGTRGSISSPSRERAAGRERNDGSAP